MAISPFRTAGVSEKAYERATEAGIPGRSSMTRDALLDALSGSGGQRRAKAS
ncbi:hypothetical protein [Streptomyces rimosus]|uniref:hypothetical protein n=1 Tax=Streptomyces rimosus TaxID=1927 RepID=UPI000AC1872C|nr:hypothetical protein [Streptomyces rimosus]